MATKKFTEFSTATPLTTSDYIVGYNAAGTAELKTQVNDILNLKSNSDAQNLTFNEVNKNLTISSGNTVSLSSLSDSSIVNSVSGLLTPLTTTNTLTGLLTPLTTTNTLTGLLTPLTTTSTLTGLLTPLTTTNTLTGLLTPLTTTNTLTGLLLPTSIYQNASGNYVLQGGNSTTTPLSVGTITTQPLILETNNFNRVIILSSGNVGIGTIEPNNTLTVNGVISSTSAIYASGGIVNTFYAGPMAGSLSLSTPISAISGVYIDPLSGYAGVQTFNPIAPLDVRGTMNFVTSVTSVNTVSNIKIQGSCAYVTNYGNSTLQVYDLAQSVMTTTSVASASTSTQPQGLYISGNYAYIVTYNSSSSVLEIFDITTATAPTLLSTTNIGTGSGQNGLNIVVQGNYAYISTYPGAGINGYIVAFDISNPYAPLKVFSVQPSNNPTPSSLTVQGKYLYWLSSGLGTVRLYRMDVSNPRKTPTAEVVYSVGGGSDRGLAIRGKYAYFLVSGTLGVVNITTGIREGISAILYSSVGGTVTYINSIILQGYYAYIFYYNGFTKVDISNISLPRVVQTVNYGSGGNGFTSNFAIQGRYAYLPDRGSNNKINIIDLGGAYIQQLDAGGIETDSLDVIKNTTVGSDLDVVGGAAFGQGFKAYKDSSVQGSLYVTSLTSMSASTYFSVASSSGSTLFAVTSTGNIQINTPATLQFNTDAGVGVVPGQTLTTCASSLLITVNGTQFKIPLLS